MAKAARETRTESGKRAGKFVAALKSVGVKENNILDSVGASDEINASISGVNSLGVPEKLAHLYGELGSGSESVALTKVLLDSVNRYESAHNQECPPDLIEQACHVAYQNTFDGYRESMRSAGFLDSASNMMPDNTALQANRAIVSIQNTFFTAVPWITSVPTDIGSGLGKLIIVDHVASAKLGGYALSGSMDGVNSGRRFFSSNRITETANSTEGAHTGQLTSIQLTSETCETVGNGATAVKLIKGRAVVYVLGRPIAYEVNKTDTVSTISGSVTLSGTTYQIGGTINNDTGEIALTSTPALANGVTVLVESHIDFNRQPEMIGEMGVIATPYEFLANPIRATVSVGIDASTQLSNEISLDPLTNLMGAMQRQLGNEKHYNALHYARRLAKNNTASLDISLWLDTGAQTRSQNIQDISIPLQALSQQMAIDTNSTGITHLYVGKVVKSWLNSLILGGRFVPSGIRDQAGIHRVGTLDGLYEIYYSPDQPETTSGGVTAATILCIGQSIDIARSGILTGQAVSPIILPIGNTREMQQGTSYFERSFMRVNPHLPSSNSFAELTLTGLK